MPNKTIDMFAIRQILRLYASGRGTKYISQATGVARNTVKKYLFQYASLRITMEELDGMSDAQLSKAFLLQEKAPKASHRFVQLEPLLPGLAQMLRKRGITKHMVYEHY